MADFDRESDGDVMLQAFGQADVCACASCRAGDVAAAAGDAARDVDADADADRLAADVVRILAEADAPVLTAEQLDLVPFDDQGPVVRALAGHDAESEDAPRPDRPAPVHAVLQAGRAC